MTLSTTLIVKDPVPAEALFRFGQSLLGDPATQQWHHIPPMTEWKYHDRYTAPPQPNGEYANVIGQGLSAIFKVEYGADGPLDLGERDEWYDDDEWAEYVQTHSGCLKVWMDTAYGYRGPNGGGCSDLHAWLLLNLCRWLEERGAKYLWLNEFTGEWYDNIADLYRLGDPEKGRLTLDSASSAC